jgi:hypothetical protein
LDNKDHAHVREDDLLLPREYARDLSVNELTAQYSWSYQIGDHDEPGTNTEFSDLHVEQTNSLLAEPSAIRNNIVNLRFVRIAVVLPIFREEIGSN